MIDFNHLSSLQVVPQVQLSPDQLPLQGRTLKSDLLVAGPKIYSDAIFRCNKVEGSIPQGIGASTSWRQEGHTPPCAHIGLLRKRLTHCPRMP